MQKKKKKSPVYDTLPLGTNPIITSMLVRNCFNIKKGFMLMRDRECNFPSPSAIGNYCEQLVIQLSRHYTHYVIKMQ
jgi:hypothetical protein